ncbi:MAG: hypothetical protein GJ680_04960 [Alteromonadaceae bacterium]|nr:hypothetical protein [Alteromonadaceae bacterium]
MLEQFSKSFSVVSVVIALSACGGGGGGSTSTTPTTSPTTPSTPSTPSTPVPLTQAVDINVDTAGLIIPYSVSAPESFLQLADLVVSELELSGQTEVASQSFVDCDNGGGASVDFSDNNNDGTYNAGDEITLDFQGCLSASLMSRFDGIATVTLSSVTQGASDIQVSWDGTTSDSLGSTVAIEGEMLVSYALAETHETLSVSADTNAMVLQLENSYEIYESLSVTKTVSNTFNYSISFDFAVSSELLGGVLTCANDVSMNGILNALPHEMSVVCNGAGSGVVNIDMSYPNTYDAYNDADANVTTTSGETLTEDSFLISLLLEGSVANPILAFQYEKPEQQYLQTLNLDSDNKNFRDIISSKVNNSIYVHGITGDESQLYVSEIDAETMAVLRTAYYDFEEAYISNFELSHNEDEIFVIISQNVRNITTVFAIDLATLALREYADFTDVIEQDTSVEHSYITSLQQSSNGDLYFIVEDERRFSPTQKLVHISEGEVANVHNLGESINKSYLFIDDNEQLYLSDDRGLSLYDIADGAFNLIETKQFIESPTGFVKRVIIDFEKDGILYSTNDYFADWNSGALTVNDYIGSVKYFPELDAAISVESLVIRLYSMSQNRQLSFVHNNNLTDLPYLDIARSVFVDDYLVITQRLGRNSDGISEYSLIKIPFNRLL